MISEDDFKASIKIREKRNWLLSCFDEAQFQLQHLDVDGWCQDLQRDVGNTDVQAGSQQIYSSCLML